MDRRHFLKLVGMATVFPAIGGAGATPIPANSFCLGEFNVAGFQHYNGMIPKISNCLKTSQSLLIKRDDGNPFDPCALKILTPHGCMLGFIPKSQNRTAATLADQGVKLHAKVESYEEGFEPWERLTISLWAELPGYGEAAKIEQDMIGL